MVVYYLMVCRSLTYAQRAAKALEHHGITAIVTKAPREVVESGCTYCVKVSEKYLSEALIALKNSELAPSKMLAQYSDGRYKEVEE